MTEVLAPLGAALGLALAVGLDVYLTLLLLALGPLAGWPVPDSVEHLGSGWVVATALMLYALEIAVERHRPVAVFWHGLHAVARPLAAALLATLFIQGPEVGALWKVAGPVLAAGVAALTHLARCGAALLSWLADDRAARPSLVAALEDALVLGLVALALDAPVLALAVVGILSLSAAVVGRPVLRAGAFSHRLAWKRSFGSLHPFRWIQEDELPADVAREVARIERPLGRTLKAAPAGGVRFGGSAGLRRGWLVVGTPDPRWVTRGMGGTQITVLDMDGPQSVRLAPVFLQVGGGPSEPSLIFPRSGPSLPALEAELRRDGGSDTSWEPWEPWNTQGVGTPSLPD